MCKNALPKRYKQSLAKLSTSHHTKQAFLQLVFEPASKRWCICRKALYICAKHSSENTWVQTHYKKSSSNVCVDSVWLERDVDVRVASAQVFQKECRKAAPGCRSAVWLGGASWTTKLLGVWHLVLRWACFALSRLCSIKVCFVLFCFVRTCQGKVRLSQVGSMVVGDEAHGGRHGGHYSTWPRN